MVGVPDLLVCSIDRSFKSNYMLTGIFIVVRDRQQMFLSGFVQDMTIIDSLLPERVYVWMLDECILQQSSSLYITTAYAIRSMSGN